MRPTAAHKLFPSLLRGDGNTIYVCSRFLRFSSLYFRSSAIDIAWTSSFKVSYSRLLFNICLVVFYLSFTLRCSASVLRVGHSNTTCSGVPVSPPSPWFEFLMLKRGPCPVRK